jgi:hypothetical protein
LEAQTKEWRKFYEEDTTVFPDGGGGTQQHEHVWGEWEQGVTVWGKWQTEKYATYTENGKKYRIGTRTDTRTCTIDGTTETRTVTSPEDPSLRETGSIAAGKQLDANGNEVNMAAQELPDTDPTKDVNVLGSLSRYGTSNMGSVEVGSVVNATEDILSDLSTQANNLVSFFNTAKTTYPTLAERFESLRAAEQQIKNRANTVNKPLADNALADYTTNIESHINIILNHIFAGQDNNVLTEFKKYYKAYQDGVYLRMRDFSASGRIGDGTPITDANISLDNTGSSFRASLEAIGKSVPSVESYNKLLLRSGAIPVSDLSVHHHTILLNEIKAEMQARIVNALGLSGVSNASQMADALITQMSDNAEFDAFIDDVVNQGTRLNAALIYNYAVTGY